MRFLFFGESNRTCCSLGCVILYSLRSSSRAGHGKCPPYTKNLTVSSIYTNLRHTASRFTNGCFSLQKIFFKWRGENKRVAYRAMLESTDDDGYFRSCCKQGVYRISPPMIMFSTICDPDVTGK